MSVVETEPAECRVVAVPGGLAQSGVEYALPGVVQFRVRSVAFRLVTAAGGGNRQAFIKLSDGSGASVFENMAPGVQAGGLPVIYSFGEGITPFGTAALGRMGGPFVSGRLPGNLVLFIGVGSAAAADVIDRVRLLVEQVPVTVGS